jgi:hypothetical protein
METPIVERMGRAEQTGEHEEPALRHSVLAIPWESLTGADGPSDGSAGAGSNIPSALSVLRHEALYAHVPEEIEDAFAVLRTHPIRHGLLYPVAVPILPLLFDQVRRKSALSDRIVDLIAEYAAAAGTLEPYLTERFHDIIEFHTSEVVGWIGRFDRAATALAIHVPALRLPFLEAIEGAGQVAPVTLLGLLQLDTAPGATVPLATQLLDDPASASWERMSAAAFLATFGEHTPDLEARIDRALPPQAPVALSNLVGKLWSVKVARPTVAPRMCDAHVTFVGERWVVVNTGVRSFTLPWVDAPVRRGDAVQVGLSAHGQAKLVVITSNDGTVTVIDL